MNDYKNNFYKLNMYINVYDYYFRVCNIIGIVFVLNNIFFGYILFFML